MKEFQYKNGGRRLYCEDVARLQELALAFNSILASCGKNFVVSGCKVTRTVNAGYSSRLDVTVSAGFAFIDGKIREVTETTFTAAPASYIPAIVPSDITSGSSIAYADGSTGPAYYDYGAIVQSGAANDFDEEHAVIFNSKTMKFPDMQDFIENFAIGHKNEDWVNLKKKGLLRKDIRLEENEVFRVSDYHDVIEGVETPADTRFVDIDSEKIVIEKTVREQNEDNEYVNVTKKVTMKDGSVETTGNIKAGGKAIIEGDIETKGVVRAKNFICNSFIIHEEEEDEEGNKTVRDLHWKWDDFKDIIKRYDNLEKEFKELMTVGEGNEAVTVTAGSINDRLTLLGDKIASIQESLEGTDSTDGIIARYEGIIAELRQTNEDVTTRMATVLEQNTQLREDNIAIKTKIENLQTNYASQLSSIQALNTRVDALRTASVSQAANNNQVVSEP